MTDLRYELKFVCEPQYLPQARAWLKMHPEGFRAAYMPRFVNNLYLDTPDLNSFNANLIGISSRQKLRLRWYGNVITKRPPRTVRQPMLELKYKENMLGGKEQEQLPCTLNLDCPWPELLAMVRASASFTWRRWLNAAVQPTLLNQYRREYYVTPDGGLRATLDTGLVAYDQRLTLRPNRRARLPMADLVVLELKAHADQEERLTEAAAHFPIPRSRNSKYVNGLLSALT